MLGYILGTLLLLAPLPGLPALPDGAEVRIVSPNLRTVYVMWRIDRGELRLEARPLPIPPGQRVRLIVRIGRQIHAYEGRFVDGDVLIAQKNGYISVRRTFIHVYHLRVTQPQPVFQGGKGGSQ